MVGLVECGASPAAIKKSSFHDVKERVTRLLGVAFKAGITRVLNTPEDIASSILADTTGVPVTGGVLDAGTKTMAATEDQFWKWLPKNICCTRK